MHIKDYLYQKDLYLSLSGKAQKPKEMTNGEWEVLDQNALGGHSIIPDIDGCI